ncbi:MAG TPA: PaaI family thioesterase [Polyangiaceae bacterium]|nr:PaaI family thioesterase [Polyangiaceae bacterium]
MAEAPAVGVPVDVRLFEMGFVQHVPHNRALGLRFLACEAGGEVVVELPYRPELVGNPDTGVIHGGAITALLDATCGAAVFVKMSVFAPIATLDLRIDYLKPSPAGSPVRAKAHCYRLTRHVAFARAVAYGDDEADPIASAAATFMLFTKGRSGVVPNERGGP